MIFLYLLTPSLGCLRNYVKYKQISCSLFLRTPLTYFFIHCLYFLLGYKQIILRTLISERWFFFIYKIWISFLNDDFHKKKEKYKIKYKIQYEDESNHS